ncbi:MAG TPA: hypothetical protein VLB45_02335 [Nitrosopumilaceae archaeon]|nr:hypothetical protein [Nitrosopumilaceae archaeon]
MSDDFLKLARKEIQGELDSLQEILSHCHNDADITRYGKDIEKHLHKIKGLAPMMGQEGIGEIARLNDAIVRHIIANGNLVDTYETLSESIKIMKGVFENSNNANVEQIKSKLLQTFPNVLNQ